MYICKAFKLEFVIVKILRKFDTGNMKMESFVTGLKKRSYKLDVHVSFTIY